MSLKQKISIYGDLEKRKLHIDIIYRLLHYYQNYLFTKCYLTANYYFRLQRQSRKQNKQITLKN